MKRVEWLIDKGSHRLKAIDLVPKAIDEVQAGIEYDNKH